MKGNTPAGAIRVITDLGLTEREAQAYLALLQMGRGSADAVARRADLKRATAYVALDSLLQQGLVQKVPRARKMIFIAKDPEELQAFLDAKAQALEHLMPQLKKLGVDSKQFNTVLYEGIEGVRRAFWYKLDDMENTEYRAFFGAPKQLSKEMERLIEKWNATNAKKNIRAKAIAPVHDSLQQFRTSDKKYLREVKTIPYKAYPNKNSIEIYDQFVRIIMFDEEAAVIIESLTLAESLRSVHTLLWETLE